MRIKDRSLLFTYLLILALSISCEKVDPGDYRDAVCGEYSGIRVNTVWKDTIVGFSRDTTDITLFLTISDLDSIVDLSFDPPCSNLDFSFYYISGEFKSSTDYHPPCLWMENDSLFFSHQPGLGPYWMNCYTRKVQ